MTVELSIAVASVDPLEINVTLENRRKSADAIWLSSRFSVGADPDAEVVIDAWDVAGKRLAIQCFAKEPVQPWDYVYLRPGDSLTRVIQLDDCLSLQGVKELGLRARYRDPHSNRFQPPLLRSIVLDGPVTSNTLRISLPEDRRTPHRFTY